MRVRESATTASAGRFVESTSNATTRAFVATAKPSTRSCHEQPVLGKRARERNREAFELVEPRVDEAALERRHDDHVGGAECAGDDPDEDEDDADSDSAREGHVRYSGSEAVPGAAHREDQLRIARVPLDLLAQVTHVHVDRARLAIVGAAAKSLEQLAAREHDAGALREHDEHLELDERQLYGFAANFDRTSRNVDPQLAALDQLFALAGEVR